MPNAQSYDAFVSNLADFTGLSESQKQFRSCRYCLEVLEKRDHRVQLATQTPTKLVTMYEQLQRMIEQGAEMSEKYKDISSRLNGGAVVGFGFRFQYGL